MGLERQSNAEKRLRVEPLIELGAGAENFGGPGLNLEGTMENVRGVQIAGQWTQAFHFQSSLALHNYPGLPDFIEDQIRDAGPVEVMPGLGFTRKLANNAQWDLYTAQALIRWEPKPWLNIQAGQGKISLAMATDPCCFPIAPPPTPICACRLNGVLGNTNIM